jgi:hypothetical protein
MYRFAIASAWKAEIVHDTIAHGGHSQNPLAPTLSVIQCYCQMLDLVGESDVHVTRVQGNTSGLQAVGLGSVEGKLPEGALIVSNDSSEPVMTIVFKWTIPVQGNAARTQWLYVDGYYLPQPQPVLSPGSTALVTVHGMLGEEDFGELVQNPMMFRSPLVNSFSEASVTEPGTVGKLTWFSLPTARSKGRTLRNTRRLFRLDTSCSSVPARVEGALRENSVSPEGHGFSRAVNNTALPGFSR